ncbi:MAG: ubiquinone/menaquinone biosynthesis C-methylase UbiE [Cryomorphaceae bacterium]|jgi:ubiquinone/menaquinone biosynthesis C-methylase UbiE
MVMSIFASTMNSDLELQVGKLSDLQLVAIIEASGRVAREVIDEYYRRCIPIYLDFLGVHWHTGFYLDDNTSVSGLDQVRMIDHLAQLAKIKPRDRVLDVGCGIGATACHLRASIGCEVIGLTPVRAQKQMADYYAQSQNLSIQIDIGHAEQLPYPDNSFDVLSFFESACHFEDRALFFKEAHRVLKPGGRIVGEDWLAGQDIQAPHDNQLVNDVCKTWAIPMLGKAIEYQRLIIDSGFIDVDVSDMRSLMALHKGFAVSEQDQNELIGDINSCNEPLLQLYLKGIASLGLAFRSDAFTIGQFSARKSIET